jgi:hypothetical protein
MSDNSRFGVWHLNESFVHHPDALRFGLDRKKWQEWRAGAVAEPFSAIAER